MALLDPCLCPFWSLFGVSFGVPLCLLDMSLLEAYVASDVEEEEETEEEEEFLPRRRGEDDDDDDDDDEGSDESRSRGDANQD